MYRINYTATHRPTSLMIQGEEYTSAKDAVHAAYLVTSTLMAKGFIFINLTTAIKVGH